MNKNPKTFWYCLYISALLTNLFVLLGGVKHHEIWRIVVGSIALALILVTLILTAVGYKRNKAE